MNRSVPAGRPDEQTEEERLEIARRYREQHGRELRELARPALPREATAVGEFSTLPLESLAAIPLVGALFAFIARASRSRRRTAPSVLVAVDPEEVHLLAVDSQVRGPRARRIRTWRRDAVRVKAVEPRFMRDEVVLDLVGAEPLKLYAPRLRTNPWAAEIVRVLGGDAPEPIDLRSAPRSG
jgi:hypothetical protein